MRRYSVGVAGLAVNQLLRLGWFDSITAHMKICNLCKEFKSENEFYVCGGYRRNQCKRCTVLKQSAPKYGLTYEKLLAMYKEQGNACKICGTVTTLVVDHDHSCCPYVPERRSESCGKCVRGLICKPCNYGLGNFQDNPELLAKAIEYLGP